MHWDSPHRDTAGISLIAQRQQEPMCLEIYKITKETKETLQDKARDDGRSIWSRTCLESKGNTWQWRSNVNPRNKGFWNFCMSWGFGSMTLTRLGLTCCSCCLPSVLILSEIDSAADVRRAPIGWKVGREIAMTRHPSGSAGVESTASRISPNEVAEIDTAQ